MHVTGSPGTVRRPGTAFLAALPALVVALAVLLPFHDKAFTIDDLVFLKEAEHVTVDPLHPTAFDVAIGDAPGRLGLASGPVMAWLLVPAVLAGGAEGPAHAALLATLLVGILGTVALALRLGLAPQWASAAGLVVATTPAVVGMAGTAMPDVPAMALGVVGIERLLAWRDDRRAAQGILAALALGLAPLARPHLLLLLPVAALLLAGDFFEARSWRVAPGRWLPLVAAPALSATLLLAMRDPAPQALGLAAATASVSASSHLAGNLVAWAIHWVLALPLALAWLLLRPAVLAARWRALAVALAAATAVALGWIGGGRFPFYFALLAAVGATVVWDVAADGWERRDPVQIALGLWLLLAIATAPYPHLPSKYLVASAPAVAILIARALAAASIPRARLAAGLACTLGLGLGVAILRADAAFAGLARRAATELVAPRVAAGERVWLLGRWGFQWYGERAGGRHLSLAPPYPAVGDLVVVSRNHDRGGLGTTRLLESYPRRTLLATLVDGSPGGRVMDARLRAGFFSNGWGYLPWRWGTTVLDAYEVLRIDAPPDGAPASRG